MPVARDLSWMAEDDTVAGNAGSNFRKLHHYPTVALAVGSPRWLHEGHFSGKLEWQTQ